MKVILHFPDFKRLDQPCPKCGATEGEQMKYSPGTIYSTLDVREAAHVKHICLECGYEERTLPKDGAE